MPDEVTMNDEVERNGRIISETNVLAARLSVAHRRLKEKQIELLDAQAWAHCCSDELAKAEREYVAIIDAIRGGER